MISALQSLVTKASEIAWHTDRPEVHKVLWLRGFIVGFIYSSLYGIYECGVVYSTCVSKHFGATKRVLDYTDKHYNGNWAIMYSGTIFFMSLATINYKAKRWYQKLPRLQEVFYGVFLMMMLEDLSFWICQYFCDRITFPLSNDDGNWWDYYFVPYRLLGYMGRTTDYWPWVPTYYIYAFPPIIVYNLISSVTWCGKNGPFYSRLYSWLTTPVFLSFLIVCGISPVCVTPPGLAPGVQAQMDWCAEHINDNSYIPILAGIPVGLWVLGIASFFVNRRAVKANNQGEVSADDTYGRSGSLAMLPAGAAKVTLV